MGQKIKIRFNLTNKANNLRFSFRQFRSNTTNFQKENILPLMLMTFNFNFLSNHTVRFLFYIFFFFYRQWSFACGNQTVFNQLTFTCSFPEEAIPCDKAPDFFYLNSNVLQGDPEVPFLQDQDVQNAAEFIPGYNSLASTNNKPASPSRG